MINLGVAQSPKSTAQQDKLDYNLTILVRKRFQIKFERKFQIHPLQ